MNRRPPVIPPSENPVMAEQIEKNSTFKALQNELAFARQKQKMGWDYLYHVSGDIDGQDTLPFTILIEQGADFKCVNITGSCFSYDSENATDFPVPGATDFAGRGLVIKITDTRAGRELTSGYVGVENLLTPGYGLNFQKPYPFRYLFYRNSKIRFDVRNLDDPDREHHFDIVLSGYKILNP